MMDNLIWYKGKMLKRNLDETRPDLGLPHLAVVMILAARDQKKTLEDIVRELILADEFDGATKKLDKKATISDLGF